MNRLHAAIGIIQAGRPNKWFARCSICGNLKLVLPYQTPADPPFYPKDGGRHCSFCEYWLITGEFHRHDPRGSTSVF